MTAAEKLSRLAELEQQIGHLSDDEYDTWCRQHPFDWIELHELRTQRQHLKTLIAFAPAFTAAFTDLATSLTTIGAHAARAAHIARFWIGTNTTYPPLTTNRARRRYNKAVAIQRHRDRVASRHLQNDPTRKARP